LDEIDEVDEEFDDDNDKDDDDDDDDDDDKDDGNVEVVVVVAVDVVDETPCRFNCCCIDTNCAFKDSISDRGDIICLACFWSLISTAACCG
jgi:hypothetical protein